MSFCGKKDLSCSINMNARANHSEYRDIGDKLDYLNKVGSSTALNRYYEGGSPDDLWAVPLWESIRLPGVKSS